MVREAVHLMQSACRSIPFRFIAPSDWPRPVDCTRWRHSLNREKYGFSLLLSSVKQVRLVHSSRNDNHLGSAEPCFIRAREMSGLSSKFEVMSLAHLKQILNHRQREGKRLARARFGTAYNIAAAHDWLEHLNSTRV